jgi:trimeric autotransporter adhesin
MKSIIQILFLFLFPVISIAQNLAINNDGSTAHPNAVLDLKGINKGLLIPRGNAATRTALNANTAKGLLLYDTVLNNVWMHNGNGLPSGWNSLANGINYWQLNGIVGNEIRNTNTGGFWSPNPTPVYSEFLIQPPVSAAGTRLMWIPNKSAFRVGTVSGDDWNADSVGTWSIGMGFNAKALGAASVALGTNTNARGYTSVALGYGTIASGFISTAMGVGSEARGNHSTAMGDSSIANGASATAIGFHTRADGGASTAMGSSSIAIGSFSTAMGFSTTANGLISTAMGASSVATGSYSTAMGIGTIANGDVSTAIGFFSKSKAYNSLTIGRYNDSIATSNPTNWVANDPLFQIGNGSNSTNLHNAMVIYKNGNMVLKNPTTVIALPASFTVPISGAGTRMMWLPEKSAFRVGTVTGNNWNADSIGVWSFATGYNSKATGNYSTALGYNTIASDNYTTSLGHGSIASGFNATSIGFTNIASGVYSTALGYTTIASGPTSTAMGFSSEASGFLSTSIGSVTKASGDISTALGEVTHARSFGSLAMGRYNDSIASSSKTSWVNTDPLLYVGNGTDNTNLHNAMVVYKNGNMVLKNPTTVITNPTSFTVPVSGAGTRMMWLPEKSAFRVGTSIGNSWDASSIGLYSFASGLGVRALAYVSTAIGNSTSANGDNSTAMGLSTFANGNTSTAMGIATNANGVASTAMGNATIASGQYSTAMGNSTLASGSNSTTMGSSSIASGQYSTAMGSSTLASGLISTAMGDFTFASGDYSTAMGSGAIASGDASTAMGIVTKSKAFAALTMGRYNDTIATSNPTSWVATDPLLILGNGASHVSRSNAMVVYKNGNTDINGYTQLGNITDGAPAIKIKKLTLNTSGSQGVCTFVAHGLTQSKILSISGLATVAGGFQILPNHLQAGFQYTLNVDNANIAVCTVAGNSSSILNATVKIVVVYEE